MPLINVISMLCRCDVDEVMSMCDINVMSMLCKRDVADAMSMRYRCYEDVM